MKTRHKIYLCNITFSERCSSSDEKKLRKTSEIYNDIFYKRFRSIHDIFSNVKTSDFVGLVNYLPTVQGGDVRDSADILVYLYRNKSILSYAYKSCIEFISEFINKNSIKSIQLSGDDVERLKVNNIDIISDIRNMTSNNLDIYVTEQKYSTRGYYLI